MISHSRRNPRPAIRLLCLTLLLTTGSSGFSRGLAAIGQDDPVAQALARIQSDDDDDVCFGLKVLTQQKAADPELLIRIVPLLESDNSEVRSSAVVAAIKHKAGVDKLLPLLKDDDPEVVYAVARGLIEDRGMACSRFTHLLRSKNPRTRSSIADLLIRHDIDRAHVDDLLEDTNAEVRLTVAQQLLIYGADWRDFVTLLADPSDIVRDGLVGFMADRGADPSVLLPLLQDASPNVRKTCAESLLRNQKGDIAECVLVIAECRRDGGEGATEDMYSSLGPKTRATIAPVLLDWVAGSNEELADEAYNGLRSLEAVPLTLLPEINELTQHPASTKRVLGCEVLRLLPKAADIEPILVRCFADANLPVRLAALETAAEQKLANLLPQLRALQTDKSPFIRIGAARATAIIDPTDMKCVEVIANAWDPLIPSIASHAEAALVKVGQRLAKHPKLLRRIFQAPTWPGLSMEDLLDDPECSPPYDLISALGPLAPDVLSDWASLPGLTDVQRETLVYLASESEKPINGVADIIVELIRQTDATEDDWDFDDQQVIAGFAYLSRHDPDRLIPFATDAKREDTRAMALQAVSEVDVQHQAKPAFRIPLEKLLSGEKAKDWYLLHTLIGIPESQPVVIASIERQLEDYADLSRYERTTILYCIKKLKDPPKSLRTAVRRALKAGTDVTEWQVLQRVGFDIAPELRRRLDHRDPETRADAVTALGDLIGEPARSDIVRMLTDKAEFGDPIYSRRSVRGCALRALESIGPTEDLIPLLTAMVKEGFEVESVAPMLGDLGPKAKPALSPLIRYTTKEGLYCGVDTLAAATKIAPDSSIALVPVRKRLKRIQLGQTWSHWYQSEPLKLLAELGDRARPMLPQLRHIVEEHELMHPETRTAAAAALAILEPNEPKWLRYVKVHQNPYFDDDWVEFVEQRTRPKPAKEGTP